MGKIIVPDDLEGNTKVAEVFNVSINMFMRNSNHAEHFPKSFGKLFRDESASIYLAGAGRPDSTGAETWDLVSVDAEGKMKCFNMDFDINKLSKISSIKTEALSDSSKLFYEEIKEYVADIHEGYEEEKGSTPRQ